MEKLLTAEEVAQVDRRLIPSPTQERNWSFMVDASPIPASSAAGPCQQTAALERHYEVDEIAEMWNLSRDTVRRIFLSEDGVLKIARPASRYKRSHVTLRVPESVLCRVHRRMSGKA
jgi:hypothetical protein